MSGEAKILTHDGYVSRYLELVGENQQHRDCCRVAWTMTEAELRQYGVKRYTTYLSFRVCRSKGAKTSRLTGLTDCDTTLSVP